MSQRVAPGIVSCLAFATCVSPLRATIRYVDDSAPPGGDGQSWATASNSLFMTLLSASPFDEIRVGAGTYKPTPASAQATAYFPLRDGMVLRGGYAGYGAPDPDEQNPAYATTLSGDLQGNDGPGFTNRSDNSFHVIKIAAGAPGPPAPCVIDSFTIVGGNAVVGGYPENHGGGVHAFGPSVISRCVFRDNYGVKGGALFADKSTQVSDCTFELNKAQYDGGAVELTSAALAHSFRRCTFRGNVATQGHGGAVDFYYAYPLFAGCTFVGNQAQVNGGAVKGSYYPLTCINCGFFGNTTGNVGGGLWVEMDGRLIGCVFSGNSANAYGGAANGIGQIYNCTIANNHANGTAGGIQGAYTMTVRNSLFWNNSDPQNGTTQSAQLLFYGTLQIGYSTVQGWTGAWGGIGNNGTDPLFVLPAGGDGLTGTADDDLRLAEGSPALDSGDNASVPADSGDVDADGDTAEPLPLDLDGHPRITDDPTASPAAAVVNRGAYENVHPPPIVAWRCLRQHQPGPNAFWLPIELDPAAGGNGMTGPIVEPRTGGIFRVEVDFRIPVQIRPGAYVGVTAWYTNDNGELSGPYMMSGSALPSMVDADTLRLTFGGGLPDRACITIDVADVVRDMSNNPITGDTDCQLRMLRGDQTSSGDVSLTDVLLARSRMGFSVPAAPGSDYNLDGAINATDMLFVKGRVLPAAQKALCP